MLSYFLPVQPFARLKDAEVLAHFIGEHTSDKSVQRDALVLVPADDGRQAQAFVEVIDHQHRADGK